MNGFINPWGLYALALIIPIVILYLLRPKPKDLHIPSLMFVVSLEQKQRFRSFFRRILRDPLLLLQILGIIAIVLVMANPFFLVQEKVKVDEDIAIVLDVSASMKSGGRFAQALDVARGVVSELDSGDKVSLILAENIPVVVLNKGDKERARLMLEGIGPKDTTTGLGGAILLASDMIKDSDVKRRVVVISDFSSYNGIAPLAAQQTAFAEGVAVESIRVEGGSKNVGIISFSSGRDLEGCFMEAVVRSYITSETMVDLQLILDGNIVASGGGSLSGGDVGIFPLKSECSRDEHKAQLRITAADDLAADNTAYAIIPREEQIDVMVIKQGEDNDYIKYALQSLSDTTVSETFPPIYPSGYDAYDIIVFQGADVGNVLPGTFPEIRNFVEKGGSLIVLAFEDIVNIPQVDFDNLLPIDPIEISKTEGGARKLFDHEILADLDMSEINTKSYLVANVREGSLTLAEIEDQPLVSIWDVGNGKVVFLGMSANAGWSDFHLKPSFPIFWHKLLTWLTRDDIGGAINFKTGEQLPIISNQSMRVKKPSGDTVEGVDVLLDEVGFYSVEGMNWELAASLADEGESDINFFEGGETMEGASDYSSKVQEEDVMKELFWIFAIVALFLVVGEWVYYKRRGSL
jgi:hypothetical protein